VHHTDGARFLRDHDHHTIALLGNPDGCPVASAQHVAEFLLLGDGQDDGRRGDPTLADDDRPVVQGTGRGEHRFQGGGGDFGIQQHALLDPVAEFHLALDDDQGAQAALAQPLGRLQDFLFGGNAVHGPEHAQAAAQAQVGQGGAQLGLEDDDEGHDPDGLEGADDASDHDHAQVGGQEGEDQQEGQAGEHLDHPRVLDEHDEAVQQIRHDDDIEEIDQGALDDLVPHDGSKVSPPR